MSNDQSAPAEIKTTEVKMEESSSTNESVKKEKDQEMEEAKDKINSEKEAKKEEEEDRKKTEELKKKYSNWPLRSIKDPHDNDVMYGRGGGTNHHAGNKKYRKLVEDRKLEYVNSKRLDKPLVALEIIRLWRAQLPPGRFLKLDDKTGLWNDVGDKKAREKTSQALREKAPLIRKQQEEEHDKDDDQNGKKEGSTKTTRFAAGTKEESSKAKKPVLARDHSLGREYIEAGESVSLEGFSWQDPFQGNGPKRTPSIGRPVPPAAPGAYPPAGRHSSSGSLGIAPPQHGAPPPPPPPDYYGRVGSDRFREYSNGRYDSWSAPYQYPPPPPPAVHGPTHQRSGSWSQGIPPPQVPHHQRSGSWSGRDHSLAFNPLIGASVAHSADRRAFEGRTQSSAGYWTGPYRSPQRHTSPTNSTPSPKAGYNVDLDIARSWSGGAEGGQTSWTQDKQAPAHPFMEMQQGLVDPASVINPTRTNGMPRPQIVKRDTSHQNESGETKHSVKRAALNRDNSMASNRLKAEYMPEYFNGKFNSDQEVKILSDNLEQSTLSSANKQVAKPEALKTTNRVSTFDIISSDLMAKPEPLLQSNRVSTIDALGLDLNVDSMIDHDAPKLENPIDQELKEIDNVPKPKVMTADNRLTTSEFLEIVNAPMDGEVDDPLDLVKEGDEGPPPLNQERIVETWLTQA